MVKEVNFRLRELAQDLGSRSLGTASFAIPVQYIWRAQQLDMLFMLQILDPYTFTTSIELLDWK